MLNPVDAFQEMFPKNVRTTIASSIYLASCMSKELRDSMVNIPRRGAMLAGHAFPVFIDKLIAAQIDQVAIGNFLYNYREFKIPQCGYAYIEYHSNVGKFHIKKSNKEEKLPNAAVHRISNAESNMVFLDFGPEFIPENTTVPFALITYGHKHFDLSFINIGFPAHDYSGWSDGFQMSIMDDISKDAVENIRANVGGKIKEEFQEQITQQFKLNLKQG